MNRCEGRLKYKTLTQKQDAGHIKFIGGNLEPQKGSYRSIVQVKNGQAIATFKTSKKAAKAVDGDASAIRKVLKGERKTHRGFEWYYA